ncbi:MAG: DUF1015 domain-containing protein, partial [Elusimicrobia bacterium]|nr:DUF1015 domain-containing protein [Elusimicrobiota bacterium]
KPFNGIRYSKKNITNLICPPYDVISPLEKVKLKKLSKNNAVSLELPDAQGKKNKYANAAALLEEWLEEGVLEQDSEPAFYFYEQTFKSGGVKKSRRGFFAALKLENPYNGSVKVHKKTLAAPKADRLSLLKAAKANLSPIFGLFEDNKLTAVNICKSVAKRAPQTTAKDTDGTTHKLWAVCDADIVTEIEKLVAGKKMFIADGHHRYETAWNYFCDRKKKDPKFFENKDYGFVMAFICPMEDPGIAILPTHRVVKEPKNFESLIEKYFDVLGEKCYPKLAKSSSGIQPLLVYKKGKYRTLMLKKDADLKKIMPKRCKAYTELAVSILHAILISGAEAADCVYVKDAKEAAATAKKTGKIAVIVPATPIEALKEIALNSEIMPQKSTYFYPKLASGVVIRSV